MSEHDGVQFVANSNRSVRFLSKARKTEIKSSWKIAGVDNGLTILKEVDATLK